jgi:hypothetical protein
MREPAVLLAVLLAAEQIAGGQHLASTAGVLT